MINIDAFVPHKAMRTAECVCKRCSFQTQKNILSTKKLQTIFQCLVVCIENRPVLSGLQTIRSGNLCGCVCMSVRQKMSIIDHIESIAHTHKQV